MGILSRLLAVVVLLAAGLVGLVALVSEGRPLVAAGSEPGGAALDDGQRAWARRWLRANDPRGLPDGAKVSLSISEAEATLLANYLIAPLDTGRASVTIGHGRAELLGSIRPPWNSSGAWLNLSLELVAGSGLPEIQAARVGGLPLPAGLIRLLAGRALEGLSRARVLDALALTPGQARVAYTWRRGAVDAVGTNLLAPEEQALVLLYQADAMALAAAGASAQPLPLAELLTGLLRKAQARSKGGDPVVENRAALAAAFAYANRRLVRDLAAGAGPARQPPMRSVVLRGRRDLAQHFTSSAMVAAQGSSLVSDAIGLFKELSDSDGGSGFSFVDLAADRAGVRFAELATGDAIGATQVEVAAVTGLDEDDFMIRIEGLPEAIPRVRLEQVYGGTRGDAYRRLVGVVEARIGRLRLYRSRGLAAEG